MRAVAPPLIVLLLAGCAKAPAPTPAPSPSPAARTLAPLPRTYDLSAQAGAQLQSAYEDATAGRKAAALAKIHALESAAAGSCDLSERLASLSRKLGAQEQAYRFARQAVRLQPESPAALLQLGDVERELDYPQQVLARYRKARDRAPDSVEPHLALASLLESEQRWSEAEPEARALTELAPENPAGWGMLARNLLEQGRLDDSRHALDEAERLSPGNPAAWILRARLDLEEAKRAPEKAAALRESAIRTLETGLAQSSEVPAALMLLGATREDSGDDAAARKAWERVYALTPDLPGLRVRLGRLRVRQGDRAGGQALLTGHRLRAEAAEALSQRISRVGAAPDDIAARRELARWCAAHGRADRARLEWGLLLERRPNDPEALAYLRRAR